MLVVAVLAWLSVPDLETISATESADITAIVDGILTLQKSDAAKQNRPLARGTHAKGVCAKAEFEVLDIIATVRPRARHSACQGPVRDTPGVIRPPCDSRTPTRTSTTTSKPMSGRCPSPSRLPAVPRQDYSTNDRTTFPINDAHAFATTVKVVTASSMGAGIRALPFRDKLSFARTAILGAEQEHQSLVPYQRRRYWSTVPYRHGATDVIASSDAVRG